MDLFYPVILFIFFIQLKKMVILPRYISFAIYLMITIYYTHIKPIYGILVAVLFIYYDAISQTFFENFYSEYTVTTQPEDTTIPKIIYQTWHTKDLPPKMAQCVSQLRTNYPEFEYHLYDDSECRAFIRDNYDKNVLKAYDSLLPGAFKADLWRYCALYKTGGIYLDIKFLLSPNKASYKNEPAFSLYDMMKNDFYVREYNHKGTGLYDDIVYTGCISSRPKNPVFLKCIQKIVENCQTQFYGPQHTSPTGPHLFASMMNPRDIQNAEYAYYEENKIGYIRNIKTTKVVLSHYPEYRKEQEIHGKGTYWKDAWIRREVYDPSVFVSSVG